MQTEMKSVSLLMGRISKGTNSKRDDGCRLRFVKNDPHQYDQASVLKARRSSIKDDTAEYDPIRDVHIEKGFAG